MPTVDRPQPGVLVVDDALAPAALDRLTAVVGAIGLVPQSIGRAVVDGLPERRWRGETEDPDVPSLLWESLVRFVDPIDRWVAVGCNPRTRVYRYGLGERFAPHVDEPWRPAGPPERCTLLTVIVALPTDDPCVGGETVVDGTVVPVRTGRMLVFPHDRRHEGRPVEGGTKLVIRSDVVFRAER